MTVPKPVVGPQRLAPADLDFQPYRSDAIASPQTIYRLTGINPVNIGPPISQANLLLTFFGCKEEQWSDPHWTASQQERTACVARMPVDDNAYWCEEISERLIKEDTMLYIAPFSCRDMWDSCNVRWRDYNVNE